MPYDGFAIDYHLDPVDRDGAGDDNTWMRRGQRGAASGAWRAVFHDIDERGVVAHVAAGPETGVFLTDTPLSVSPEGARGHMPMLIARRRIAITAFTVVHQPYRGSPAPLRVDADGARVTVAGEGFEDAIDLKARTFARRAITARDAR
jgi:hypothetical protein